MSRSRIYLCFFLSGFSGLVNEVVWSRLFVYTMGSSHLSIAVVVSVFMGGLALGSYLGGPMADRSPSPLRLYGWLVALAGLLSGAVAPLLFLATPFLGAVYRLHDGAPGHPLFTAVKALVCAATILVPTTLMGATLPVLARHLTRSVRELGSRLGALYAVNTLGAVAGAAAAGFYLIARFGLGWSAALAAAVDLAVGGAVLLATRQASGAAEPAAGGDRVPPPPAPAPRLGGETHSPVPAAGGRVPWAVRVAVAAFGVSGFVNMCLQLGWTRALILSIGNSTYAFSLIVGIFIFGLALGGWIAGLFADRLKEPAAAFGWLLVATAVAAGATIPWLGLSTARFSWRLAAMARSGGFNYLSFLWVAAAWTGLTILPSTILMGMALPLVGRLRAGAGAGVGRSVGAAYAANTIGAIFGTALTGFVLVPLLGRIWKLLYLSVGLGFLAGAVVLVLAPGRRRGRRLALLGLVTAVLLGMAYPTRPFGVLDTPGEGRLYWHPVVLALGGYNNIAGARLYRDSYEQYARGSIRQFEPLYYRDGEAASVAVLRMRSSGHIMLNISGKTDASAGEVSFDTETQLLMGHLPILVHPRPRRALNLGLGGGMSLGAMASHPEVEEIDLLELCPEVEEAARLYFGEANRSVLTNPKVRKIIGDGRNHLAHTARTYDVISSEPSNFWIAGLGNLFTEDFYRLALRRLNPGGIVCQWIYGYSIRLKDYHTAMRTFLRVFPHTAVWSNSYGDTLLLGAEQPLSFDRSRMVSALEDPQVRASTSVIGVRTPEDLFRFFQCEGSALLSWVGDGPTNRDFFPVLEFSSPLGYYDQDAGITLALASAAPGTLPLHLLRGFSAGELKLIDERRGQGRALNRFFVNLYATDFMAAVEAYEALARGGDPWCLDYASHQLCQHVETMGQKRGEILSAARKAYDTPELCMADGFRQGPARDQKTQIEAFRRAAAVAPPNRWESHLSLAVVESGQKLFPDALKTLETARQRGAPPHRVSSVKGIILGMQNKLEEAEALLRDSLASTPVGSEGDKGETAWNLGYCIEKRGRFEDAEAAYRQAIELGNDSVRAGIAISRCLRLRGELTRAAETARQALKTAQEQKRDSGEARAEIARARAAVGELAEAVQWMETATRVLPGYYDKELQALKARAGQ